MNNTDKHQINWNQSHAKIVDSIISIARDITHADVGVLFLTSDGIFLEAADWGRKESSVRPPASELPTYRLNWWAKEFNEYGGLTAYVAVEKEILNLSQNEVIEHKAHKGKWDAVFLEGDSGRCKGLLAVPLISQKTGRMHGVLKVENPNHNTADPAGRFKHEQRTSLVEFASQLALGLDNNVNFWSEFVRSKADLKVSHIVELLKKGRSLQYNLTFSLGYVLKLFSSWLGTKDAVHVFWNSESNEECHLLPQWDQAKGEEPFKDSKRRKLQKDESTSLIRWLKSFGPKVIQPGIKIDQSLITILFKNSSINSTYVDVIRLKGGDYDLGAIVLPHSTSLTVTKQKKDSSKNKNVTMEGNELEDLTKQALNIVYILGRFFEDEYNIKEKTYLPMHRRPHESKTCAILFADIRNFSQLTQILRLMGHPGEIEIFLDRFCSEMGKLIEESKIGRVDKFMGDGIMALFGETLTNSPDDNIKKVLATVECASRMLSKFKDLYKEWFENGLKRSESQYGGWSSEEPIFVNSSNEDFSVNNTQTPLKTLIGKQFNENVEVRLGIGINIGEVFFDYFGYGNHREYTAIGDHVNFAQRLESTAGGYDDKKEVLRTSIILSQTAYQYLQEFGYLHSNKEPIWLRFKGFGFTYPVYELCPEDLNFISNKGTNKIGCNHNIVP